MNTSQPELKMVVKEIFCNPYASWSPEEITAYYQTRTSIRYFPVADEAQIAREKIDNILVGRFEFDGESYQLPENFDWTINPSRDIEWLIMFHKFYYAVGLGIAYHETHDWRYVEKWIELTSTWINTVPLDFLPSHATGRRVQNWIFAHYYFVTLNTSSVVKPDFYLDFLASIHRQVRYLLQNLTPARNHRTLELYAIFLAAVVFPEFKGAEQWLEFSKQELLKNMQSDLLADGVQCELSTDYHHIVLRNYLGFRKLALINQIPLPEEMDLLIQKALEFSLYVHKPDGRIPAISDADTGSFLYLLGEGYQLYGCEEMQYVASQGNRGKPPALRSKAFPESGYYILRSGWGDRGEPYPDERYLIFDCGPLGAGNHGHLDLLSLEMAAYGQSLIVDPGRYTYDESGKTNWRVIFRGTGHHNTVLVDRKNQTRYEFHKKKSKINGPEPDWELRSFISQPGFDYLHGIGRSHEYEVAHERKIFFLCPEYWIICDLLLAKDPHDYDLLFHLSDQALGKVSMTVGRGTLQVDAPHLVIAQAVDPEVRPFVEDGYVSPVYGVKYPAPVVRFARHAADACYHTILYPYKSESPSISVEELPVLHSAQVCSNAQASALCITVAKSGQRFKDYYFVAHQESGKEYAFDRFTYNGTFLFIRKDREGNLVNLHGEPGTVLTESGNPLPIRLNKNPILTRTRQSLR